MCIRDRCNSTIKSKKEESECLSVRQSVCTFLRADNGVQSKVRFSCADPEVRQSNTEENFTL